jgi:hypothetical protein
MKGKKESVLVVTFSTKERCGWPCPGLSNFMAGVAVKAARGEREIRTLRLENYVPHDTARNFAAKSFRETGLDWLVMIDNDMEPQSNLLDMLDRADDRMDVIVPRFFAITNDKNGGMISLNLGWLLRDGETVPNPNTEWIEIEKAGTGVMAVRKSVFHRLKRPYFQFSYDADGISTSGEDVYFCAKARAAGLRIWGNNYFEADHFHTISLSLLARITGCARPAGVAA